MSQGRDDHGRFAGGGTSAKAKAHSKLRTEKPGSVISGTQKSTGRKWTAKVGPSGKLIGKTFT